MPHFPKVTTAGNLRHDSAPAVYRPQNSVQLRPTAPGASIPLRSGPPVYRPERSLQMLPGVAHGNKPLPSAPPVFRPGSSVSIQPGAVASPALQPAIPSIYRAGPPVYRPGRATQQKPMLVPPSGPVVIPPATGFRPAIQPALAPGSFSTRIVTQPRRSGLIGSGTIQRTAPYRAHVKIDFTAQNESTLVISRADIEGRPTIPNSIKQKLKAAGKDLGHGDDWALLRRAVEGEFSHQTVQQAADALGKELNKPVPATVAGVERAIKACAEERHKTSLESLIAEDSTENRKRGATGRAIEELYKNEKAGETKDRLLAEMYANGSTTYSTSYQENFEKVHGGIPPLYKNRNPRSTSPERYRTERTATKRKRVEDTSSSRTATKRKRVEDTSSSTTTTTTTTTTNSLPPFSLSTP
jgi:hypothetical protein